MRRLLEGVLNGGNTVRYSHDQKLSKTNQFIRKFEFLAIARNKRLPHRGFLYGQWQYERHDEPHYFGIF